VNWLLPLRLALAWIGQWLLLLWLLRSGLRLPGAFVLAAAPGLLFFIVARRDALWVRAIKAGAFPASFFLARLLWGAPTWIWPAILCAGALLFPKLGRGDAPLWRSPRSALRILAAALPQAPRVALDAGCGAGDALVQMARRWPDTRLIGLEASLPLRALCRLRVPRAQIKGGDMWTQSWAAADLVYLFLTPEAMARAAGKCAQELAADAWVASLEFELPARAVRRLTLDDGRPLWLYRANELTDPSRQAPGHGARQNSL
jgi:hypothetical protein